MNSSKKGSIVVHTDTSTVRHDEWRRSSTGPPSALLGIRRGGHPQIRSLVCLGRIPATSHRATSPSTNRSLLHSPIRGRSLSSSLRRFRPRGALLLPSLRCPLQAIRATGPFLPASGVPTLRGSSMGPSMVVNDDEAASRAEYHYQQVQGHASRTSAYGDPYGSPGPCVRSSSLRTSFDSRAGESQSLQIFGRIEDALARMERHFTTTASAQAPSSVPTSTPSSSGEFSFIHFHFELLIFACNSGKLISAFCTGLKVNRFSCLGFGRSRDRAAGEMSFSYIRVQRFMHIRLVLC
jgi:hypothetical protein